MASLLKPLRSFSSLLPPPFMFYFGHGDILPLSHAFHQVCVSFWLFWLCMQLLEQDEFFTAIMFADLLWSAWAVSSDWHSRQSPDRLWLVVLIWGFLQTDFTSQIIYLMYNHQNIFFFSRYDENIFLRATLAFSLSIYLFNWISISRYRGCSFSSWGPHIKGIQ